MSYISMEESSGCLSWLAAYTIGSYLFVAGEVHTLHPLILVTAPLFMPYGIILAALYLPLLAWSLLMVSLALLVVGCLGFIRIWSYGRWRWWPVAALAVGLVLPNLLTYMPL